MSLRHTADSDGVPRPLVGRIAPGSLRIRARYPRPFLLFAILALLVLIPMPRSSADWWIGSGYIVLQRCLAPIFSIAPTEWTLPLLLTVFVLLAAAVVYVPGPPFNHRVQLRLIAAQWVVGTFAVVGLAAVAWTLRATIVQTPAVVRLAVEPADRAEIERFVRAARARAAELRSPAAAVAGRPLQVTYDLVRARERRALRELRRPAGAIFEDPHLASDRQQGGLDRAHGRGITTGLFTTVTLSSSTPSDALPFVLAHEYAHVAGVRDEAEANLVAFVACAESDDPVLAYAGWKEAADYGGALLRGQQSAYTPFVEWIASTRLHDGPLSFAR